MCDSYAPRKKDLPVRQRKVLGGKGLGGKMRQNGVDADDETRTPGPQPRGRRRPRDLAQAEDPARSILSRPPWRVLAKQGLNNGGTTIEQGQHDRREMPTRSTWTRSAPAKVTSSRGDHHSNRITAGTADDCFGLVTPLFRCCYTVIPAKSTNPP